VIRKIEARLAKGPRRGPEPAVDANANGDEAVGDEAA